MKSYQSFVIITHARTGATLLMRLLNSHPNIVVKGEALKRLKGKTTGELWKSIFCQHPLTTLAVGAKLSYKYPIDSSDRSIWSLIDNPEIKKVHLTRDNGIRSFVSRQIAAKNQQWLQLQGKAKPSLHDRKVEISIPSLLKYLRNKECDEADTKARYAGRSYYHLTYEQYLRDPTVLKDLQALLGVPTRNLHSDLIKQNPEPIQQLVANYGDVANALRGTRWEPSLAMPDAKPVNFQQRIEADL